MLSRYIFLLGLFYSAISVAIEDPSLTKAKHLYLGEAYYHAFLGNYLDAITRLDTGMGQFYSSSNPNPDPLHFKVSNASFPLGDFELSYGMPQRAGLIIKAVLDSNVTQDIRNESAYRIARILMQKGDSKNALTTIEKIIGNVPENIREDEQFLRAQIYMLRGKFGDAIPVLKGLQSSKKYEGFSSYNLAIALMQDGKELEGQEQLDRTGQIKTNDEEILAIKDKANLMLGNRLIASDKPALAKMYLERVRLIGPFSNKALLGSGWTDIAQGKFDQALVPWSLLSKRKITDKAVQESMLGVPYAYSKLGLHGKAALLYGSAMEDFGTELEKLDTSIKSIREGNFLKALTRNEFQQDKNWIVKLRDLPTAPETYYLLELMASNDFQESLQNYIDLHDLRKRLEAWEGSIGAYQGIIKTLSQQNEAKIPDVDRKFIVLDTQKKLQLELRQALDDRLKHLYASDRRNFLETAEESVMREKLIQFSEIIKNDNSEYGDQIRTRIKRLEGVLYWHIMSSYDARLTESFQHLHQLDAHIANLRNKNQIFVRARQAATQSYKGYENQLQQLGVRVRNSKEKVNTMIARQGHMLVNMAIAELDLRRKRLDEFQVQARFALSESYDRASKIKHGETGNK
jgi:hypothetical protein